MVRDNDNVLKYKLPNYKYATYDKLFVADKISDSGNGKYTCVYGNCDTGYGERVGVNDNSKYEGFLKNSSPHGPGFIVYDNGDEAMCEFKNGNKNGLGMYEWTDGNWYIGYFKDDKLHGKGMYVENDVIKPGTFYNGDFDVKYDYYNNGISKGCVSGECDNGFGKWVYENGDSYTGWWVNKQMNGIGFYQFTSGGFYVGEWSNGKKHGYGMYEWDKDSSYSGYWDNDQLHGLGVYYYKENGESKLMSGMFNNGDHQSWDVKFTY